MKLFWKLYAVVFLLIVLTNSSFLLAKNSSLYNYYTTLIAFNTWYILPYALNILNIILTFAGAIILILYALNIKCTWPFMKELFFLRLLTEMTGHHYEWKFIQSIFAQDHYLGALSVLFLILPILPSYIAHYEFAFKNK